MYNEKILEAFVVPIIHKIIIWACALLIIALGIYLSISYSDWLWLSRFGALIVILSLTLEATGFVQKFIRRIINITMDIMPEVVKMQVKRNSHLYGLSGTESEEEIDDIAKTELKARANEFSNLAEKTMTQDLRKTEFGVATLGTLLWAFSDLLNKL
jgi:hypothetical protein